MDGRDVELKGEFNSKKYFSLNFIIISQFYIITFDYGFLMIPLTGWACFIIFFRIMPPNDQIFRQEFYGYTPITIYRRDPYDRSIKVEQSWQTILLKFVLYSSIFITIIIGLDVILFDEYMELNLQDVNSDDFYIRPILALALIFFCGGMFRDGFYKTKNLWN